MSKAISLASSLLAFGLSSCAATQNGAEEGLFSGGFTAYPVGDDGFYANFRGNSFTTAETIQVYWLYNCAVLTLSRGYDGFEVASASIDVSTPTYDPSTNAAPVAGVLTYLGSVLGSAVAFKLVSGSALYDNIRVVRKPFTAQPPKVFDAAVIKNTLEPYVLGKKCNGGNVCLRPEDSLKPGAAAAGM